MEVYAVKFRALDYLAVAAVGAAALISASPMLFAEEGETVTVMYDAGEIGMPLSSDDSVTLNSNGHTLTVTVKNGKAWVSDTDCPDGLCRRTGSISKPGESIACLPAKVLVKVGGDGGIDGVAG